MDEVDLRNKKVLIRVDFNVPIKEGKILSDAKIRASLPTIELALKSNAGILLVSHLGRPKSDAINSSDASLSLKPLVPTLSNLLHHPISFAEHWIEGCEVQAGEIVLCENVRFLKGEEENDPLLSKKMAALCDVFILDAFASAHRVAASTVGINSASNKDAPIGQFLAARKVLASPPPKIKTSIFSKRF